MQKLACHLLSPPFVFGLLLRGAAVAALAGAPHHARAQSLSLPSDRHGLLRAAWTIDPPAAREVSPEFVVPPAFASAAWTASPVRHAFAADLLAAPARVRRNTEAAATWLSGSGTMLAAPACGGG